MIYNQQDRTSLQKGQSNVVCSRSQFQRVQQLVGLPQFHLSSRNIKNSFFKRKRNMKGWVMFCAVLAKTLVWESLLHADFLSFVHSIAKIPWSTGISNIKRIIGQKKVSVVISASKICDIYFQNKTSSAKRSCATHKKFREGCCPLEILRCTILEKLCWSPSMHHPLGKVSQKKLLFFWILSNPNWDSKFCGNFVSFLLWLNL